MRPDEYAAFDAAGLAELVHRGDVTPHALAEAAIKRIDALHPRLNAVVGAPGGAAIPVCGRSGVVPSGVGESSRLDARHANRFIFVARAAARADRADDFAGGLDENRAGPRQKFAF